MISIRDVFVRNIKRCELSNKTLNMCLNIIKESNMLHLIKQNVLKFLQVVNFHDNIIVLYESPLLQLKKRENYN